MPTSPPASSRSPRKLCWAWRRPLQRETGMKNLALPAAWASIAWPTAHPARDAVRRSLFIQPSAGDGGGALGAALWADNMLLGNPRATFAWTTPTGARNTRPPKSARFSNQHQHPIPAHRQTTIGCWTGSSIACRGQSNWLVPGTLRVGPRALGNRSILADPRNPQHERHRQHQNQVPRALPSFCSLGAGRMCRDLFRSARTPCITIRRATCSTSVPVRPAGTAILPAITHVDGTGRLQTVFRDANPRYYI